MPPHGKADKVVPDVASVTFVEKATQLGTGAELDGDADMPHPFSAMSTTPPLEHHVPGVRHADA